MQVTNINFDRFNVLKDAEAQERIRAARARLGSKAVLLCHHYQRADVYQHADLTGDSLILSKPHQIAILPDLAAGCSMADMASLAKVERSWRELAEVLGDADEFITPI